MELDDFKRSWNALDKQLQKENIVDEKQIAEFIAKYQSGAKKGIHRINCWQRFSVLIGIVAIIILVGVLIIAPSMLLDIMVQPKSAVMAVFIGLTLLFGMWWDIKTYRWSCATKVDEMPVVTVIERINTFQRWIKYEVVAISVWSIIFVGLYYWLTECYKLPALVQTVLIALFVFLVSIVIYFIYKKMIYKNLDRIRRNLNELKELEIDE